MEVEVVEVCKDSSSHHVRVQETRPGREEVGDNTDKQQHCKVAYEEALIWKRYKVSNRISQQADVPTFTLFLSSYV